MKAEPGSDGEQVTLPPIQRLVTDVLPTSVALENLRPDGGAKPRMDASKKIQLDSQTSPITGGTTSAAHEPAATHGKEGGWSHQIDWSARGRQRTRSGDAAARPQVPHLSVGNKLDTHELPLPSATDVNHHTTLADSQVMGIPVMGPVPQLPNDPKMTRSLTALEPATGQLHHQFRLPMSEKGSGQFVVQPKSVADYKAAPLDAYGRPYVGRDGTSEPFAPAGTAAVPALPQGPPQDGTWTRTGRSSSSRGSSGSIKSSTSGSSSGSSAPPQDRASPETPVKRRSNLPKDVTDTLRSWLNSHVDNPYPSEDDKYHLMAETGLTLVQVSNWFINARRRMLPPHQRRGKSRTRS